MAGSISQIGKLSTRPRRGECCRPNRLPLGRRCSRLFTRFQVLHQRLSAQTIVTQLISSRLMKNNSRTAARTLTPKAGAISSPPPAAPVPRWLRFWPLYIALAVLAVYSTALGFNFIGFDDTDILKHRYFIIGDLSKIKLAFTTDAFLGTNGSFYRPLQTVSFMLDALIGGPSPFIYHFTNLVLYIVGSLCVFWLLRTLGYQRLSSLLLALLFALHPMFVPMVAWVPTRGDLLLTIFIIVRIGGRANRKVQFGLLWALLCILPVMLFRNADAQYIFDYLYHRAYLPSIGLIIVLAELLNRLGLRNERYFQRVAIGAVPFL